MKTIFVSTLFLVTIGFSCGSESSPSPTNTTADCSQKPSVTASQITASPCGQTLGVLEAKATGGTGKLMYSINGTSFQEASRFQNLAAGKYTVTVKDEKGCTNTAQTTIESNTSYQTSVKTIIETKCAVSGCHAGNQVPDFRNFSTIQANAMRIKERTSAKTMPPTGALSDQEINLIKCWVDDGAKNN